MKLIFRILLLSTFIILSINLNAQLLNEIESELLNEHFEAERGEFDFKNKKVGFFHSTSVWTKEEFFKDLIEWNESNQTMSNQFIILTEDEKEKSGGYDVFIYAWSKILISRTQVGEHIEKIKKNEAQQRL